ncbi:uncharacterized protein [Bemisia tabaci]
MRTDRWFVLFILVLCWGLPCQERVDRGFSNVRTVLFREMDLEKDCWERSDVALLLARRLMQELVPTRIPVDAVRMCEYFELAERTVREVPAHSAARRLLYAAFADTVGGYLKTYGLSLAKEAYYEGKIDYRQMKRLYDLESRLKESLGTDGKGWGDPVSLSRFARKAKPLELSVADVEDPCQALITQEFRAPTGFSGDASREDFHWIPSDLKIPLPFLDDDDKPRAMAVPLKRRSLYSLSSSASADVLIRYYTTSVLCLDNKAKDFLRPSQESRERTFPTQCFQGKCYNPIKTFQVQFYRWIITKIIPHLEDETWYVGFGGVLRIIETIKEEGFHDLNAACAIPRRLSPQINFGSGFSPRSSSSALDYLNHYMHYGLQGDASKPDDSLPETVSTIEPPPEIEVASPDKRLVDIQSSRKSLVSNRHANRSAFVNRPKILSHIPEHPSAVFYLCTVILLVLSFWLISCVAFVFCKIFHSRNFRRADLEKNEDSFKLLADSEGSEEERGPSIEEELMRCFTEKRYFGTLSQLNLSTSDSYEKLSMDNDEDIAVSSVGDSFTLSDESKVTFGQQDMVNFENDDTVLCATETQKQSHSKKIQT